MDNNDFNNLARQAECWRTVANFVKENNVCFRNDSRSKQDKSLMADEDVAQLIVDVLQGRAAAVREDEAKERAMIEKWVAEFLAEKSGGEIAVAQLHQWLNLSQPPIPPDMVADYAEFISMIQAKRSNSNIFHHAAFKLWRAFHSEDGTPAERWFYFDENTRQRWVNLSKKLESEKVTAMSDAVGMPTLAASAGGVGVSGVTQGKTTASQFVARTLLVDRQLDRIRTMPPLIRAMTQDSNAWVVGSQAEFRERRINIKPTSDWDVIVPYAEWQAVMTRLASAGVLEKAGFSSVGGVRTMIPAKNGGTIGLDIWPGEISHHMMKPFTHVAWQPKTGSVWVRGE